MRQHVTASGIVAFGRATWAHLQHPHTGCIGVLAIYTPMVQVIELGSSMSLRMC